MVQHVNGRPFGGATRKAGETGFTMIELLIAMTVLLAGIAGILTLQLSGMRATAYSRHATEASVLGEAKMEWLLIHPLDSLTSGTDQVDAHGASDESGLYVRTWSVTPDADGAVLDVTVSWFERGSEPHSITMRSRRVE